MGFFSDLKDDLSQAVNELMPEDGAEEGKKNLSERERRTAMPENRSSYGERPASGAGVGGSLEENGSGKRGLKKGERHWWFEGEK